jgi:hypothetical protein
MHGSKIKNKYIDIEKSVKHNKGDFLVIVIVKLKTSTPMYYWDQKTHIQGNTA